MPWRYGMKFQGRLTSNGEVFDVYKATAAHKSLPLPSFVRVTNLENNSSMIVRVNDRGPFVDDRLIDVSYWLLVAVRSRVLRIRAPHAFASNISMYLGTDDWRATEPTIYRRLQVGANEQRSLAEGLAEAVREVVGSAIPVEVSKVFIFGPENGLPGAIGASSGCQTAPNNSTVSRCSYVTMDFQKGRRIALSYCLFELIH